MFAKLYCKMTLRAVFTLRHALVFDFATVFKRKLFITARNLEPHKLHFFSVSTFRSGVEEKQIMSQSIVNK